jgi:predicted nucleic acid-binding protein
MKIAIDTNILVYAEGAFGRVGDAQKVIRARAVMTELIDHEAVLPVQVLGELHNVLTRKAHIAPDIAKKTIIRLYTGFSIAHSSGQALLGALDLSAEHGLPTFDALILSVAAEAHCRYLLSEDFQNGFTYRGVTILNPFTEPLNL